MTTFKEKVENHLTLWFLGTLVAGFVSGISAYELGLKISDTAIISQSRLDDLSGIVEEKELVILNHQSEIEDLNRSLDLLRDTPKIQRWLNIKGVEGLSDYRVRVIARVNGLAFSYPSRTVWSTTQTDLPTESFPLPESSNGYRVSFEILGMDSQNEFREFTSQEVQFHETYPVSSTYKIYGITASEWGNTRGIPTLGGRIGPSSQRQVTTRVLYEVK